MKPEKKLVNFRISETLANDLKETSDRLDIPQSQIARVALKKEIDALKPIVDIADAVRDTAEAGS